MYAENAYELDPGFFELGVPILGICYGHQVLAHGLGGVVDRTEAGEYGKAELSVVDVIPNNSAVSEVLKTLDHPLLSRQ